VNDSSVTFVGGGGRVVVSPVLLILKAKERRAGAGREKVRLLERTSGDESRQAGKVWLKQKYSKSAGVA
jgi:hypothetical protein